MLVRPTGKARSVLLMDVGGVAGPADETVKAKVASIQQHDRAQGSQSLIG
jgi:hypothetical protein